MKTRHGRLVPSDWLYIPIRFQHSEDTPTRTHGRQRERGSSGCKCQSINQVKKDSYTGYTGTNEHRHAGSADWVGQRRHSDLSGSDMDQFRIQVST